VADLVLVRPMSRLCFVAVISLAITACAVSPKIAGRYAAVITDSDVERIRRLTESRPDIHRPLYAIFAYSPIEVTVKSGSEEYVSLESTSEFTAVKRNGRWQIASRIVQGGVARVARVLQ
jgi:hypothetical protein